MWIQFLLPLLAGAALVPVLGWRIEKSLSNRLGLGELTAGSESEAKQALPAAAAKELEQPRSAKGINGSILEAAKGKFGKSLDLLEKRALENSDNNIYEYLAGLIKELKILGTKLAQDSSEQAARMTYTKYSPLVEKLVELTAPNYYGDFVSNPDHWEDPRKMRVQVELSVLAVAKEASGDIRRLNSDQELDFKVSVESLIGKSLEDEAEERASNFMEDLLSGPAMKIGEVGGGIKGLTEQVEAEAERFKSRQLEEEKAAEARRLEEEQKRREGGSKSSRDFEKANRVAIREVIAHREFFKQTATIYGPNSSEDNYLVKYTDEITGVKKWTTHKGVLKAAETVDAIILREEKKHDYKHSCVYCREDAE